MTDHFTRYTQAYVTKDQWAVTVAKVLVEKFFVRYSLPTRIHSNQGLLQVLGVRTSRKMLYHLQRAPQPKCFNRTPLPMLGTLQLSQKHQGSQQIALLGHAYNCTQNYSTGFSPYFLLFGWEACLPINLCFETPLEVKEEIRHQQYIGKLWMDLKQAYQLVVETSDRVHLRNKQHYDVCVCPQQLEKGDIECLYMHSKTAARKS